MKITLGYLELASRPPSCMFHIAKGQAISILVVGQTRSELPPPLPGSMWLKPKANRVSRVYHYDHCPPVESGPCENIDSSMWHRTRFKKTMYCTGQWDGPTQFSAEASLRTMNDS